MIKLSCDAQNTVVSCTREKAKLEYLVPKAVDETLTQIFTEIGTNVIYEYLDVNFDLKCGEIYEKPKVFSDGLEKLLGSAAPVIEKKILMNLYFHLKLKFTEKKNYEFQDYVEELKEGR